MPAGPNRRFARGEPDLDLQFARQEALVQFDDGHRRRRDLQVLDQARRDPLVDQDAQVLGIFAEFGDVKMAVAGFEQVGLRAAAHVSQKTGRGNRHGRLR